jgi:hypothetical protein
MTDTEWVVLLVEVGVIALVTTLAWLGVGRR